jgi:hypothetical protein
MRFLLSFTLVLSLSFSSASQAGGLKEALDIIVAAEKVAVLVADYIKKIHDKSRNAKVLRYNLPMVTIIKTVDGRLGIGHMKAVASWSDDYYLYANPEDAHNQSRLNYLIDNNKYEALANLANNDNFKNAISYTKKPWELNKRLEQSYLMVKDLTAGKSDILAYSNLFPNYMPRWNEAVPCKEGDILNPGGYTPSCEVRSIVSFAGLKTLLDELISPAFQAVQNKTLNIDTEGVADSAAILAQYEDSIYKDAGFFTGTDANRTDNQITVYAHLPTMLGIALAEKKAGLR